MFWVIVSTAKMFHSQKETYVVASVVLNESDTLVVVLNFELVCERFTVEYRLTSLLLRG
jgi:hypothetical protein